MYIFLDQDFHKSNSNFDNSCQQVLENLKIISSGISWVQCNHLIKQMIHLGLIKFMACLSNCLFMLTSPPLGLLGLATDVTGDQDFLLFLTQCKGDLPSRCPKKQMPLKLRGQLIMDAGQPVMPLDTFTILGDPDPPHLLPPRSLFYYRSKRW